MISVLIPFFNEEENLPLLTEKLLEILKILDQPFEIIYVNDGSTDNSIGSIEPLDKHVKVFSHKRQMGKGKALATGFSHSKGDIIIFMDADLQDEPDELPKFFNKIEEGYDLVNGWRKNRNDELIKTLPSRIGNQYILTAILNSKYHDINCGFKAIRREVLEDIPLYGDNFRFLPVFAEKRGYKTTEIAIKHNERKFGKSKYGFFRRFSIFADIFTTYFIFRFSEKPFHFFGAIGGSVFLIGFIQAIYLSYIHFAFNVKLSQRPVLLMSVLLMIVGIQIVLTGVIGELIVYMHRQKQNTPPIV